MQEIDYTFRKLFAIDSDFNKIREEIHNKLGLIVSDLDSLTTSKIKKFKQELEESQKVMYALKEEGDQLAKEYVESIINSSEIFILSDEINESIIELEYPHVMNILDAAATNNYLYLQRNGDKLSQEQINALQKQISLYKELQDVHKQGNLVVKQSEMDYVDRIADLINEKDSELSNLIRNFVGNLSNVPDNIPSNVPDNIPSNVPDNISNNIPDNISNNTSNRYKYCTRCGTKLNSDALFCSNCGNKFSEVNDNSNKILEFNNKSSVSNSNVHFHDESFHLHSNSRSDFCCPNCGSENVQSLPIIYQSGSSGTSSVTQTTQFIGISQGNTMTDLARSVAPPQQKEEPAGCAICILLGIGSLFLGIFQAAIAFAVVAVIFYLPLAEVKKYNEEQFPIEYDNWKNSYLCHRCGTFFRK